MLVNAAIRALHNPAVQRTSAADAILVMCALPTSIARKPYDSRSTGLLRLPAIRCFLSMRKSVA
jgi:hypothetical protein